MYNEVIMVEKSETSSSEDLLYVFGMKIEKLLKNSNEEITRFLRRELNFVDQSGSLSYLGLKSGPRYEKS